jgi:hypothetical protein
MRPADQIIEQDFDVKQGKQHKSPLPAHGKLMMQLELTMPASGVLDTSAVPVQVPSPQAAQTTATAPPPAADTPPSTAAWPASAPSAERFAIDVVAVQARNLLHAAGAFVCISFLTEPASMEQRHFLLLDHDVGGPPGDARLFAVPPQWRTGPPGGGADPTWNESHRLTSAHPAIQARVPPPAPTA